MSQNYTLEDYIQQLRSAPKVDERVFAAFKLGRERDPRVINPLIAALQDPDAAVRARAAEALGTRDEAQVVPPLLAALQDEDPAVRRMAVRSLGYIADERALPALAGMLADDDASLRAQAADALGNLPADLVAEVLVTAFLDDPDTQVQTAAKQSLARPGNQHGAAILLNVLPHIEEDTPLLVDILEVLGSIGDPGAGAAVEALTHHPDETVSAMVAWALNRLR